MKKKIVCLLLTLSMITVGISACGGAEDQADQNQSQDDTSQGDTSQDDTSQGDNSQGDTGGSTGNDTTGNGDQTVATDPTLESIYEEIKSSYGENYLPSVTCEPDTIEAVYGINSDWYEAAIVEIPMISAQIDTFMGFKADEGNVDTLLQAVKDYQDKLKADTMQYPSNLAKIQASQVISYGDYVFFIMLGIIENEEQEEAGLINDYTEQNQIAIDIIDRYLNTDSQ